VTDLVKYSKRNQNNEKRNMFKKIQFSLILNLVCDRNLKKKIQKTKIFLKKKNANGPGVENQIRKKSKTKKHFTKTNRTQISTNPTGKFSNGNQKPKTKID
jgi:hypothetical protein